MKSLRQLLVLNLLLINSLWMIGSQAQSDYSWTLRDDVGLSRCTTEPSQKSVCLSCRMKGTCTGQNAEAASPIPCPDSAPYCTYATTGAGTFEATCVAEAAYECSCSDHIPTYCLDDPFNGEAYIDCRNLQVGDGSLLCPADSTGRTMGTCDCGDLTSVPAGCNYTNSGVNRRKEFPCDGMYLNPDTFGCQYYFNCLGDERNHPDFYPDKCMNAGECMDIWECGCSIPSEMKCKATCPYFVDATDTHVYYGCNPVDSTAIPVRHMCDRGGYFDSSGDVCTCVCYDGCDKVANYVSPDLNDYVECVNGAPVGPTLSCIGDDSIFNQAECECQGNAYTSTIAPPTTTAGPPTTTAAPPTTTAGLPTTALPCPPCGFRADPDNPQGYYACGDGSNKYSTCPTTQLFVQTTCTCV